MAAKAAIFGSRICFMKPIAVFQHTVVGAPGAVVPILKSLGREVRTVHIVDGEPVPRDATAFGGLVFMGGYMGVHDDFPWIAEELALIRDADAHAVAVAGHCLGSQLAALALGGSVAKHVRPEIGWQPLDAKDDAVSRDWWGPYAGQTLETFQWHGDTFTAPQGAHQIASSRHCAHQALIVGGRHLLLQSHLEMTPALVELSLEHNGHQLDHQFALGNPAVCDPGDVRRDLDRRTQQMHAILAQLYSRWIKGCG